MIDPAAQTSFIVEEGWYDTRKANLPDLLPPATRCAVLQGLGREQLAVVGRLLVPIELQPMAGHFRPLPL